MKKLFFPAFLIIAIVLIFFYPVLIGNIPFPGDLLVGSFAPYNSNTYGEYGPGAVPNKAQGSDVITQLYPWKYFVIKSIFQGSLPFWNPHQFSGNPLLANFQSGSFYPLNLVFLSPFMQGWTLFILLIPILSALFLYLFLREIDVSNEGSIFGGIVFAFSSYMVVWMEYGNIGHTLLWLPLILLLTERLYIQFKLKQIIIVEIVLVVAFLAGYIQGYFYMVGLVFFYFLFKSLSKKSFSFFRIVFLGILLCLPLFLGAFQLFPTLEIFGLSTRGNYTLDQMQQLLNPVWYSITTIIPDFFGNPASRNFWFNGTYIERVSYFGLIPFTLALLAVIFVKKKEVRFFSLVASITLLLTLDLFVTKYLFLLPIPVLSTAVPTRLLSMFVFSGSVLAAFGLDYYLGVKNKKVFVPIIIVGGFLLFAWIWVLLGMNVFTIPVENVHVTLRNLILPTFYTGVFGVLTLVLLSKIRVKKVFSKEKLILLGISFVTLFDLFYFFHKITPFSPQTYVYPKTPVMSFIEDNAGVNRFWGYGAGYIRANFQTIDGSFSPEGYDALHLKTYSEFIETSAHGTFPVEPSRTDANIAPGFGTGELNSNPFRQKVLNILGVKYVVHKYENSGSSFEPDTATFDPKNYKLVWQNTPWQVYQNLNVAPRFFLTNSYEIAKNKQELFKHFYSNNFDETKSIIVYKDPNVIKSSTVSGEVELKSYEPNKIVVHVSTPQPTLLFSSDSNYPGWTALIDGKTTEILTADHAFRAVVVPTGEHTVVFEYRDQGFVKGIIVSLGTLVILIVTLIILRRRKTI